MVNGRHILYALSDLKSDVTENELLKYFISSNDESKNLVEEKLHRILDDGVNMGLIVKNDNKYSLPSLKNMCETDTGRSEGCSCRLSTEASRMDDSLTSGRESDEESDKESDKECDAESGEEIDEEIDEKSDDESSEESDEENEDETININNISLRLNIPTLSLSIPQPYASRIQAMLDKLVGEEDEEDEDDDKEEAVGDCSR